DVSLLRSNKKLDVLVSKKYAMIKQKLEGTKLLASNEIQYYFNEQPTKKYIHIIVERLPGPTITSSCEDILLSEIALLKAQIVKSEHKTPSKPFVDWTLPQICQLYRIGEQGNASITEFPANLQNGQFRIDSQFNIIGPNGHGPVDYTIHASEYLKIIANRKRKFDKMQKEDTFRDKVVGIVTDAIIWFFLECSYDNQERPNFKLSNSITVDYNNDRMEYDVKGILGHISWLLEEVQKPAKVKSQKQKG
ncbi:23306_t:CDS:2, partial [Gigaspora margarita]